MVISKLHLMLHLMVIEAMELALDQVGG